MIPSPRDSAAEAASHVDRWLDEEHRFGVNLYAGGGAAGSLVVVEALENPGLILTAPHSVNHVRTGQVKVADRGTGGLVLALCTMLGCWGFAVDGPDGGDANWDEVHPLKTAVAETLGSALLLVDFHGMKARRGVDVEVGTAQSSLDEMPAARRLVHALIDAGMEVMVNERFDAKRATTMTAWAQSRGVAAIQLELAQVLRPPEGAAEKMETLLSTLSGSLQTTP